MFLKENKVIYIRDVKKENMDYEKMIHDLDLQSENFEYEAIPIKGNRKRMRLHQLSWEEKLQRKKLRNRIAAQTSRDRKKAKMDYLEEAVKDLKQQNDLLFIQVEELKKKNEMLVDVNEELKKAISSRSYTCSCLTKPEGELKIESKEKLNEVQERISVKDEHSFLRPAESLEIPQQKGEWTVLTQVPAMKPSWKLWKIFLLYLLSQKCWEISKKTKSCMSLKNWQQVCWKKLNSMSAEEIQKIPSMSGQEKWASNNEMVGSTPEIMESNCTKTNLKRSNLQQQHSISDNLTAWEKIFNITLEHSYALPKIPSPQDMHQANSENNPSTLPLIEISEPEIIFSDSEAQQTNEIEIKETSDTLDIPFFPDFCSPKSEASSDLGYESIASPYGSDLSSSDSWNEFWGDTLPDLFPELI